MAPPLARPARGLSPDRSRLYARSAQIVAAVTKPGPGGRHARPRSAARRCSSRPARQSRPAPPTWADERDL